MSDPIDIIRRIIDEGAPEALSRIAEALGCGDDVLADAARWRFFVLDGKRTNGRFTLIERGADGKPIEHFGYNYAVVIDAARQDSAAADKGGT